MCDLDLDQATLQISHSLAMSDFGLLLFLLVFYSFSFIPHDKT